jgi:hypothetical protein
VIYIYLDRFGDWCARLWNRFHPGAHPAPVPAE